MKLPDFLGIEDASIKQEGLDLLVLVPHFCKVASNLERGNSIRLLLVARHWELQTSSPATNLHLNCLENVPGTQGTQYPLPKKATLPKKSPALLRDLSKKVVGWFIVNPDIRPAISWGGWHWGLRTLAAARLSTSDASGELRSHSSLVRQTGMCWRSTSENRWFYRWFSSMVVLESRGGLHIWWVFIGFQSCVKRPVCKRVVWKPAFFQQYGG